MAKNQDPHINNTKQMTIVHGGCHCGGVRFTAQVPIGSTLLHCNCSICAMTGFIHLIATHQQFELKSGESLLSSYRFNTGQANHLFCSQCGVKSFYQPRSHPDSWSINAHCLDDYDAARWQHQDFDGKHWEQAKDKLESNYENT
ncbi:GFA family protein [Marinicella sediminis]|nr:GFA family protein [Marinicella sediminis]